MAAMFLSMGVLFGAVAGPMAYIIFYREYVHHFGHQKARSLALKGALVTFLSFVGFSIVSGYVISRYVVPAAL